jgi:hypothetical protein
MVFLIVRMPNASLLMSLTRVLFLNLIHSFLQGIKDLIMLSESLLPNLF